MDDIAFDLDRDGSDSAIVVKVRNKITDSLVFEFSCILIIFFFHFIRKQT
jgi:hypothetical protein